MSSKQTYECDCCKKQVADYSEEPGWIRLHRLVYTRKEKGTGEPPCYGEEHLDFCSKECLTQYFLTKKLP